MFLFFRYYEWTQLSILITGLIHLIPVQLWDFTSSSYLNEKCKGLMDTVRITISLHLFWVLVSVHSYTICFKLWLCKAQQFLFCSNWMSKICLVLPTNFIHLIFFIFFQKNMDRRNTNLTFKSAAIMFVKNKTKHYALFFAYKSIEVFCISLHVLAFYSMFYRLDGRFLLLGFDFIKNPDKVEDIFDDRAKCPWNYNTGATNKDSATIKSCNLLMNGYYKNALVLLWFVYVATGIGHGIYVTVQLLAFLTCTFKRWLMNWISVPLMEYKKFVFKLNFADIFVLGLFSKSLAQEVFMSFIKRLKKKKKLKNVGWSRHTA